MRLRTYTLTREDANRLASVLTRHGGERTLRDLERRHRFWPHMVEAAAAAGVVCIETRRPATGRPSRVAVLHAFVRLFAPAKPASAAKKALAPRSKSLF